MKSGKALLVVATLAVALVGTEASAQFYQGGVVVPNSGPTSGMMTPGVPIDPRTNRVYIDYMLNISMPGQYQIDLVSNNTSAYDPYLYLLQNGMQIDSNDDGGGSLNSRISRFLAPGQYVIRVSSWRTGPVSMVAPFSLSVQGGGGGYPPPPVYNPGYPTGGQAIAVGMPVQGMFLPSFPVHQGNRPYTDYILNVPMPGMYQIDLMSTNSSAYDPYLYLLQNGAQIATNDDGGGYPNARISQFLSPGVYVIRVSSFRGGPVGPTPFTLMVSRR